MLKPSEAACLLITVCLFACQKKIVRENQLSTHLLADSYISITDSAYGASTASPDNTAAIQKALNVGGNIYVPSGVFQVANTLNVHSNTHVYGPGTIQLNTSVSHAILKIENQNNVQVSDITLNGSAYLVPDDSTTKNIRGLLDMRTSNTITVQNVTIKNSYDFSIEANASQNVTISGCTITAFGTRAIDVYMTNNTNILNNTIDGGQYTNHKKNIHGIQIWGADTLGNHLSRHHIVTGNNVKNVSGGGIWCTGVDTANFSNNTVGFCGDVGIDAENSSVITILNNTVSNCLNGAITTFYGSSQVSILHNQVTQQTGFGAAGIYLYGDKMNTQMTIRGNTINSQDTGYGIYTELGWLSHSIIDSNTITCAKSIGMLLKGANYITVANNNVTVGTSGSASVPSGIYIDGGSNSSIVRNVIISNYDISPDMPTSPDRGGVHLHYQSTAFPCHQDTVAYNRIQGFKVSANDNCWASPYSQNRIVYDTLNTIYRRSSPQWNGYIAGNVNVNNPTVTVTPVAY